MCGRDRKGAATQLPAEAAGLPQIVPTIKVPELTGAITDGTVRSALLV
jgi:hypothetical protein